MSTELTTQERIVLVYNPSFQNQQVHFTSRATTYGQLREELVAQNIVEDMSAWKVMEGRTRVTLEHDEAMLPTNIPLANKPGQVSNDLILIMTQKKMDLGARTERQEIMAILRNYKLESKENAKQVQRIFGNYTQLSNKVLIAKFSRFANRNLLTKAVSSEKMAVDKVETPIEEVVETESPLTEEGTPEETFEEIIQRKCDDVIKGSTEIVKKCEEIVGSIAFILKEVQEATKQGPNKDLLSELEDIKRLFV